MRGTVGLNATSIRGYAWGDWSLTKGNYVTYDFSKFQKALDSGDEGRLTRLVAHELGHVLNSDRYSEPEYWQTFKKLFAKSSSNWDNVDGYYYAHRVQSH